jgi:lipid-binding SYLF domain-containing protein
MNRTRRSILTACLVAGVLGSMASSAMASAASLAADGHAALNRLYATKSSAVWAGQHAKAILVFPRIYKGGLIIGAQTGNGVLFVRGQPVGYYNISAASYGLQAGGQAFSYALFFMKDSALAYLKKSAGWSVGSGPSLVVVNKGVATSTTSTTLTQDVIAYPFGQSGLMAGLGLEGSKISPIHPN